MIGYLEMPSGISGDMFLGCLVDAGWPLPALEETIHALGLPVGSWAVRQERVMRGPLAATLLVVEAQEGDQHRHLHHIRALIEQAALPAVVRARAIGVFTRLAEAEAQVHGTTVEEIHFHEVGALDAIIDIVGVCAGLAALGIETLHAGALPLGEGWTRSAHGRIPLPAPATLALLATAGAPVRAAPGPGELVTPTGAALVAELATFGLPPMRLQRAGLGAGRKEFEWPNIARLWLGDAEASEHAPQADPDAEVRTLALLETNIDDMNPELYGAVVQRLFDLGALDVWMTPIQMKKGRPAMLLSVLAPLEQEQPFVASLLRETTTLGVRVSTVRRHAAHREMTIVETLYGAIPVKLKWVEDRLVGAKPEYEACVQLAAKHDLPVRLVYEAGVAAAHTLLVEDSAG
jgi:pyridinium-3,5-bisthiocarboxylic acid mononucleotide nickel chelatase